MTSYYSHESELCESVFNIAVVGKLTYEQLKNILDAYCPKGMSKYDDGYETKGTPAARLRAINRLLDSVEHRKLSTVQKENVRQVASAILLDLVAGKI